MIILVFALHIAGGTLALLAGIVAIGARKGARLHRRAGIIFMLAMVAMAASADVLAVVMPGQLVNLLIGTFTLYLIGTAWLATRSVRNVPAEVAALAVVSMLALPFAILSIQLAIGADPLFHSSIPFEGPVLVAMYVFTVLLLLATVADVRQLRAGGLRGRARIERHLWRMCLGLTFAAGSAFTNGLPRLLPASIDIPLPLLFLPQLAAFLVLVFWMVRVRFTGWYSRNLAGAETIIPMNEALTVGQAG
jgi:uncharacterized membrane protein